MKKKGFTLIELLAVIVILAIIALIATPLVLKYIETSRIESFKVSVENIKDSALKYVASEQLNGKVTYPVIVDVQDLDFKGKEDYTGKVMVYKDGTVEEYIQKDDYRVSNGSLVNGKNKPYLKVKEGKIATIDDKNGYIYSFYSSIEYDGYKSDSLTFDVINGIFEVSNGTIDFQLNAKGSYSTGSKIIVKDKDGNVYKEYQIVIFGDTDGDGKINANDLTAINRHVLETETLTGINFFAADLNRDGIVNEVDKEILKTNNTKVLIYNQITNKLEEV